MTLRCKEGDLAYVVGGAFPENIGRVVTVERFLGHLWSPTLQAVVPVWEVTASTPLVTRCGPLNVGWTPDAHLRPLRDGPDVDVCVNNQELTA